MKNTNKLLVVLLALAIAVSSIAVTALTTSAAGEVDTNTYDYFWGSDCYVGEAGWNDEAYRDYDMGTYNLDYYEKDLFAPFDPATTQLEEGKTYKAIYWLTINNINNFYVDTAGWEVKAMPTEEYYFNITNDHIWDGEADTSVAIVVPFKVTDINNVKLKLWTHGALIDGSCVEAIYVVGADYNVYAEEFYDIVVEGVANAGSNVEANKPADDEWTPSDPDAVVEPEPVEGINATILKPVLATQNYADIIGEDSYGAQASLGENVKKFDASISTLISESFVQNMVETTEVVAGNQDNYVKMWTGTMTAAESGEYTLIGRKIDNGFVMFVNGEKVYEYWGASHWFDGAEDRVVSDLGSFEVVAGESYDVEIYFLEIGGGDALEIFATTTPGDTNSGANINDVFDFDLVETTLWLADGGHWADFTNDTLVGTPGEANGGQCTEENALFDESFANLVLNFSNWEEKVVSSFAEPIEAYDGDTAYMIVYEGTLVPNVSGEYTFGANAVDNGFYLEIGDDVAYEFWVGRRWNDDGSGNTYYDSVALEAGVEYPFFAAFLETNGGQTLDLVASVDGGDRISVDELFTFSTKIIEEEDPDDPVNPVPSDEPTATPTPEQPSDEPTATPTPEQPSDEPTATPTPEQPSDEPTATPTPEQPSDEPTATPTPEQPSDEPTATPTPTPVVKETVLATVEEEKQLDGTAGVEIDSSILDEVKDELVIEFKIKPDEIKEHLTIMSIGDAKDKPYVVIGMRSDGAYKLNEFQGAAGAIKTGEWAELKYVIGTEKSQIYLNGELYAEGAGVDLANLEGTIKFGQATVQDFINDPAYKGAVSDIKISTTEVVSGGDNNTDNNDGNTNNGGSTTKPVTGDVAMLTAILAAGVAGLGGLKLRKKSK